MRPALIAAPLIACTLAAQSPGQRFQEAWARYTTLEAAVDEDQDLPPGLPAALDDLGRAWAAWAEAQGATTLKLPALAGSAPAPSARTLGRRGEWTLLGLDVPVPCGSHRFLALFKEASGHWKLALLDLHEARSDRDPLGAREHVQAQLLEGPKVAVASTPPWCTSCWSVLHARVESPGSAIEDPKVLARLEDSVYRCADQGVIRMTPLPDGIRLRYAGMGPEGTPSPRDKAIRVP
ncbi:MAG TPA: hypothetical protein VFT46_02280 [Holophagaceae bacterium]|nr:hypothetical protein [Holophagaceae bacterium]